MARRGSIRSKKPLLVAFKKPGYQPRPERPAPKLDEWLSEQRGADSPDDHDDDTIAPHSHKLLCKREFVPV